ncbi:hypothetical protein QZH41_015737, partial [Actinostola sp. cb2023]
MDILTRVRRAGIVLNPDKFQFAGRSVDFAGFRVSATAIEPLPKYLDAIRDFPSPTSTTDIRSWFGLVNQVANYAQLRETMAPFKPFLSPRYKFSWSTELEEAFKASKEAIVGAIRQGVTIFDNLRRTCLRPDWSRRGIGYFLLQKHCNCPSGVPDCCLRGWRITLAGSRFLASAEQRYAAIEGEALAVAWGLEQTRYFTQGCDDLVIVTDHKPLVKIFGDRTLDEITNSRLFRLKQRTLPWRFDIVHLPGKSNHAADATSRHPSPSGSANGFSPSSLDEPEIIESALVASIRKDAQELGAIPWTALWSHHPFAMEFSSISMPPTKGPQQWSSVPVPSSIGIRNTRERCADCNRNVPSQAATPPLPSQPPSTPFEAVFADFFDYGGRHYLVIGDRLSGWVEVFGSTAGTDQGGSTGLVRHLRTFFATFGVPEELASDGEPEFTASHTENFLQLWGVRHRVSSVAFPQSNGRAEVAVKTAKRLLKSNTGPTGSLDHDRFLRAMLQLRNTPDRDCNLSPAQIIFGRPLRDSLSFVNRLEKFFNPHVRPLWRQAWAAKEEALRTRISHTTESLKAHSRPLRPLAIGETVFLQNQRGPTPNKWDRSGTVLESLGHDQYQVKVDGSGRLTLRNRRFLRAYKPVTPSIRPQPAAPLSRPCSHKQQPTSPHTDKIMPEEATRQSEDGPLDAAPDTSPPPGRETPPLIHADDTAPDEGTTGIPPTTSLPTRIVLDTSVPAPLPPPPKLTPARPNRARQPPKRYEPAETGR